MIKSLAILTLISLFTISLTAQKNNSNSTNRTGTWNFEAPSATEGYNSGSILIGMAEQKNTGEMSFTGSDYKLPCMNVKFTADSLLFSIYLQGLDIKILLKIENESKMAGIAIYSEGEVPLFLTKAVATEK